MTPDPAPDDVSLSPDGEGSFDPFIFDPNIFDTGIGAVGLINAAAPAVLILTEE